MESSIKRFILIWRSVKDICDHKALAKVFCFFCFAPENSELVTHPSFVQSYDPDGSPFPLNPTPDHCESEPRAGSPAGRHQDNCPQHMLTKNPSFRTFFTPPLYPSLLSCYLIHPNTNSAVSDNQRHSSHGPKASRRGPNLMWDEEKPRWKLPKHDFWTVRSINQVWQQHAALLGEWCGICRPPLALSPTHFTANEPYTQYQHPGAIFNSAKNVCRSFTADHCQSWFMAQL